MQKKSDGTYSVIRNEVSRVVHGLMADSGTAIIHPSFVANSVFQIWAADTDEESVDMRVRWTSVEQIKQIARDVLRVKADTDSEQSVSYQGDMFTGILQTFYPTRGKDAYKRIELLTKDELEWNVQKLEKSAKARQAHADALRAYIINQAAV